MMPIARGRRLRGAIDVALGDRRQADEVPGSRDLPGRQRRADEDERLSCSGPPAQRARAQPGRSSADGMMVRNPRGPGTTMRMTGMPNSGRVRSTAIACPIPAERSLLENPGDLGFEGLEVEICDRREVARPAGRPHQARGRARSALRASRMIVGVLDVLA